MTYSLDQLKSLYADALGDKTFPGGKLSWLNTPDGRKRHIDTMAAIAMAESSGNPDAENQSSTATGLWQIMFSVWVKDPDVQALGVKTRADLHDPSRNAKCAVIVFSKQGYQAWEVWNNGAYKDHITPNKGDVIGQAKDAVTDNVSKWVRPLTNWAGETLATAGVAILGGVLLVLGVVILSSQTKAGKLLENAIPAGKVVKAAKAVKG